MNPRVIRHIVFAGDLIWIALSAVLAFLLITGVAWSWPNLSGAFSESLFLITSAGIAWVFVFHRMKLDGFYGGFDAPGVLSQLFTGIVTLVVLIASANFLFHKNASRLLLLLFAVILLITTFLGRLAARTLARRFAGTGPRHRVVIAGKGRIAQELAARIQAHPEMRWEVVGFLFPSADDFVSPLLLQGLDTAQLNSLEIEALLKRQGVDELVLTSPVPDQGEMINLVVNCRHRGIRVSVVPNLYQLYVNRPTLVDLDGLPLLSLGAGRASPVQALAKRGLDLVLGFVLLLIALPVMIVSGVLLWIEKGKAIESELRCGRNGKKFRMFRFKVRRTLEQTSGLERILHLLSFSELPQLFNVLKGDMSLVGPRPEVPERVKRYSDWQRQRLTYKPGMAGLAQVHGLREENSSDDKAYYDLRYIQDWSLFCDLSLILQTIWTLCRRLVSQSSSSDDAGTTEDMREFPELAHADRP